MKIQTKITRFAMLVSLFIGVLLSACSPERIVTTNTSVERTVEHWVESTCHKSNGIDCDTMGQ